MALTQAENSKIDKISDTVSRIDERCEINCGVLHNLQSTQQKHEKRISRLEWVWAAIAFVASAIGGTALAMSGTIASWFKQ